MLTNCTSRQYRLTSYAAFTSSLTRISTIPLARRTGSRKMATVKDSIPHIVRTAHEPRQQGMWTATLSKIEQVNSTIRLLRLSLPKDGAPLRHLPGQYVDLHIPNTPTVGGFTITSAPQTTSTSTPYIELAIQNSPSNPPAEYLWRAPSSILQSPVSFKIGGTFAFPPLTLSKSSCEAIDNVILIAGGVGVNPIMSMLSAMDSRGLAHIDGKPAFGTPQNVGGMKQRVRVLYSSKREGSDSKILFEDRLTAIAKRWYDNDAVDLKLNLFETGPGARENHDKKNENENGNVSRKKRRINHDDLLDALGNVELRTNAVVYVCGVPGMTDEFVGVLKDAEGLGEERVLCEKWW